MTTRPDLGVWLMAARPTGMNDLRDMEPDRAAGKRTVAVLIGPTATRVELTVPPVLPYVAAVALAIGRGWSLCCRS
jgi:1,4-dihydroxy-2-naphthoate octaprenyltransferase